MRLCAAWVSAARILLAVFRWFCAEASSWPGAAVSLAPMGSLEVLAYYLLLAALLAWPWRRGPIVV